MRALDPNQVATGLMLVRMMNNFERPEKRQKWSHILEITIKNPDKRLQLLAFHTNEAKGGQLEFRKHNDWALELLGRLQTGEMDGAVTLFSRPRRLFVNKWDFRQWQLRSGMMLSAEPNEVDTTVLEQYYIVNSNGENKAHTIIYDLDVEQYLAQDNLKLFGE